MLKNIQYLRNHFKPGKGFRFPVHIEHAKKRSFNPSWLDNHNYLVYSPAKDGAYCKFCVLFGATTEHNSSKIDHLVKSSLTFWTTACEKPKDHGLKSALHKTATLKSKNFHKVMKTEQVLINVQLNAADALNIERNKQKLASIIKTLLFCGHQNIALRGHRESAD